jgi:hypothetical protein
LSATVTISPVPVKTACGPDASGIPSGHDPAAYMRTVEFASAVPITDGLFSSAPEAGLVDVIAGVSAMPSWM